MELMLINTNMTLQQLSKLPLKEQKKFILSKDKLNPKVFFDRHRNAIVNDLQNGIVPDGYTLENNWKRIFLYKKGVKKAVRWYWNTELFFERDMKIEISESEYQVSNGTEI